MLKRKLTNKELKELKLLAKDLPVTYYEGKQEREKNGNLKTVLYPVNNERRLIKAFKDEGIEGIKKYIAWVNENNKRLNAKYGN